MDGRDPERFEDLPILGDLRDVLAAHMREATEGVTSVRGAVPPERRRTRAGWVVGGLRRATPALAVAVALAVVAVGLLTLHHRAAAHHTTAPAGHGAGHHTLPVNPPPTPGQQLANQAQQEVLRRDHACASPTNRGQTIDHGSPGHAILSLLGVLRRPPLALDPTNKVLYSIGWDIGAGVYVNYIRRARTEDGRSYWIVPEARTSPFGPIPVRCYREFHSTLVHDLRHATPSLRAQALAAQRSDVSGMRAQSEHRAGLCFVEIGLHVRPHPGAVGFGCSPAASGVIPGDSGNESGDRGGGTIMSGMTPDGVVSVTIHYDPSAKDPAHTITSNVVNNVYVLKVPPDTAHQPFPNQWQIKLSDGRVLTPQQLENSLGVQHGGG
jgi:hypothetical protein